MEQKIAQFFEKHHRATPLPRLFPIKRPLVGQVKRKWKTLCHYDGVCSLIEQFAAPTYMEYIVFQTFSVPDCRNKSMRIKLKYRQLVYELARTLHDGRNVVDTQQIDSIVPMDTTEDTRIEQFVTRQMDLCPEKKMDVAATKKRWQSHRKKEQQKIIEWWAIVEMMLFPTVRILLWNPCRCPLRNRFDWLKSLIKHQTANGLTLTNSSVLRFVPQDTLAASFNCRPAEIWIVQIHDEKIDRQLEIEFQLANNQQNPPGIAFIH